MIHKNKRKLTGSPSCEKGSQLVENLKPINQRTCPVSIKLYKILTHCPIIERGFLCINLPAAQIFKSQRLVVDLEVYCIKEYLKKI